MEEFALVKFELVPFDHIEIKQSCQDSEHACDVAGGATRLHDAPREVARLVGGQLVRGEARITLPDHFRKLASGQGITIFLTPHGRKSRGLTYEDASPSSFSVFELDNGSGSYTFDWEVKAVRKGYENYRVYRPWNESLAAGEGDEQWRARLKSIENKKNRGGKP